jgi:AMMECR1 domain-containing protein
MEQRKAIIFVTLDEKIKTLDKLRGGMGAAVGLFP